MWIIHPRRGFYSAVQHRDDPETILIRSRAREDLENLSDLISPTDIIKLDNSDYPFRVIVPRDEWVEAVAAMAAEVDWTNMKNAVADDHRHNVYMRVWSTLHALTPAGTRRWGGYEQPSLLAPDKPQPSRRSGRKRGGKKKK